jgi:hypothetical protein
MNPNISANLKSFFDTVLQEVRNQWFQVGSFDKKYLEVKNLVTQPLYLTMAMFVDEYFHGIQRNIHTSWALFSQQQRCAFLLSIVL